MKRGAIWRLERDNHGKIFLHRRGNNLGEPVAVFRAGEEAVAERILVMLNTFQFYDHPRSPLRDKGPYAKTPRDGLGGSNGFKGS